MTSTPQGLGVCGDQSPVQRGGQLLQNRTGLSRVQPCLTRGACRASRAPPQAKFLDPGTLLLPKAAMTAPGSAHLTALSPCHTLVCNSFSGSYSRTYWSPCLVLYPFTPSLRVAVETRVGRDPRGCSHKDTSVRTCHVHTHMRARQGSERI